MRKRYFAAWDWEFDRGVGERDAEGLLPPVHAIAFFDFEDRLYHVTVVNNLGHFEYQYYTDVSGRVVEKRGLDPSLESHVAIIVKYTYDGSSGRVTETAWCPTDDHTPATVVRSAE